jgi:hypothetical protein
MTQLTGWYVDKRGKHIEVNGKPTLNSLIVDLTDSNIGLAVVGQEFFDDETDAIEQAKLNAEETIEECEERLKELTNTRKKAKSNSGNRSIFSTIRRRDKEEDPLGPPDYGVGRQLKHRKGRYIASIQGYRESKDESVSYMLKTEGGKTLWLSRENLDSQFEVLE